MLMVFNGSCWWCLKEADGRYWLMLLSYGVVKGRLEVSNGHVTGLFDDVWRSEQDEFT